jgi:hypothetical protein
MSEYPNTAGARRRVARSRGAGGGILLVLLGAWGALIPFIGPYFNFSFTPDTAWTWTSARGWLEVLPGAATFVGGLLLLLSASRAMTMLGAWLAVAGGAWFIVGPDLQQAWSIGSPGQPAGTSDGIHSAETLAMFSGLGAVILFLAAAAFGRLSVVSSRDVRAAERREQLAAREAEAREKPEVAAAQRDTTRRDTMSRDTTRRDTAGSDTASGTQPAAQPAAQHAAQSPPSGEQAYEQRPYGRSQDSSPADPNRR